MVFLMLIYPRSVARYRPPLENFMELTGSGVLMLCHARNFCRRPNGFRRQLENVRYLATSHSLTVSSQDPDAIRRPSGENATAKTVLEWPASVCWRSPVLASHSLTVLSPDPDAIRRPSGEN